MCAHEFKTANMKSIYLYLAGLLFTNYAYSQTDSTSKQYSDKSVFSANIVYQSLAHFLGRTDSLGSYVVIPVVSYQHKSGLYIQAAGVGVGNAKAALSLTGGSLEAGLRFKTENKFDGNIYASRFLYQDKSVLVQSALQYQAGINTSFKTNIINFNIAGDVKFSSNTDYGLTPGIDKMFLIPLGGKTTFVINPVAAVFFGTQRFTNSYTDKISQNIFGVPVSPTTFRTTSKNINQFSLLAYEYNLNLILVSGKFNFSFNPSFVSPQNLVLQNGEYGKDRFYFSTSVGIRL